MSSSATAVGKGRETDRKTRPRPDSFVGRAGRGQGNPGQGTGEAVGHSADLHRRPVARQRGAGHRTGQGGQGDHGARGAGARFPGQRDGRGAAAGSRIPPTATFWTDFPAPWRRPAGWTAVWPRRPRGCRWLPSASRWTIISYCAVLPGAGIVLSARRIYNIYGKPPQTGRILRCGWRRAGPASRRHGEGLRGAHARLRGPDRAGRRALSGSGTFCGSGWRPGDCCNRGRNCCRRRAVAEIAQPDGGFVRAVQRQLSAISCSGPMARTD